MLRDPVRFNAAADRLFAAALRKAALAPLNPGRYEPRTQSSRADVQVHHYDGRAER